MEYILSVEEMRKVDALAINKLGITGAILMENAGLKSAQCIANRFDPIAGKSIGIICGKGNNGGDGFVIGRHLSQMGAQVTFSLVGKFADVSGDAKVNMDIARNLGLTIHEVQNWNPARHLRGFDLVIDALLGTGLKGDVSGVYADIIGSLNIWQKPVVSVDAPSGLDCDKGRPLGVCVKSDLTITMGNVKTGMLLYPGRELVGRLFIADLNVPSSVFEQINLSKYFFEPEDYQKLLPPRPQDAYKNKFGKLLVLAGSRGLSGAAVLTSKAALYSGAGMVILGCPQGLNSVFEEKLTEVMTDPLPETDVGSLTESAFDAVEDSLQWSDVLALGPGLSTHHDTVRFVHRVLTEQSRPIVIDADGLNNLAENTKLLEDYKGEIIITPHVGEFSRLSGLSHDEILRSSVEAVERFAKTWGVVVLLKGAPTIIADPGGAIYFNPSGNSGMATAGAGDVLTGIIAGFLAQKLSAIDAAVLGAFVHGLAGDRAASLLGQRGMVAGDILEQTPQTLADLENMDKDSLAEYSEPFPIRLF
ncbi:MAG: NAD(P)H-hydrate dehydratase [bacterium]